MMHHIKVQYLFHSTLNILNAWITKFYNLMTFRTNQMIMLLVAVGFFFFFSCSTGIVPGGRPGGTDVASRRAVARADSTRTPTTTAAIATDMPAANATNVGLVRGVVSGWGGVWTGTAGAAVSAGVVPRACPHRQSASRFGTARPHPGQVQTNCSAMETVVPGEQVHCRRKVFCLHHCRQLRGDTARGSISRLDHYRGQT